MIVSIFAGQGMSSIFGITIAMFHKWLITINLKFSFPKGINKTVKKDILDIHHTASINSIGICLSCSDIEKKKINRP